VRMVGRPCRLFCLCRYFVRVAEGDLSCTMLWSLGCCPMYMGRVPEQSLHVFLTQMQIEQKKMRKGEVASVLE